MVSFTPISALSVLFTLTFAIPLCRSKRNRTNQISLTQEHVLVVGASSGVGRVIATSYAARGAKVCIIARREVELKQTLAECLFKGSGKGAEVIMAVLDASDAENMVKLRTRLEKEWGRLDTMLVVAGVSALRPLLEITGVSREGKKFVPEDCTLEGLQAGLAVVRAGFQGNYVAPLVSALTFIPMMTRTSPSPSILQLSSVAAVVPQPTRSLYASSKTAALMLYQALSIEHPEIRFTNILPITIEGDFRATAVDNGPVLEGDPGKSGWRREDVAKRCIEAIDAGERTVFMGPQYRWAHLMYWLCPNFVERLAAKKYNFEV